MEVGTTAVLEKSELDTYLDDLQGGMYEFQNDFNKDMAKLGHRHSWIVYY